MKFDPKLHVAIDDIVTNQEIISMFSVTPQVFSNWKSRSKDFPEPIKSTPKTKRGILYRKSEILHWYANEFPDRMAAARALVSIIDGQEAK